MCKLSYSEFALSSNFVGCFIPEWMCRQNRLNTANKSNGAAKGDNDQMSQVMKSKWKSQNGGVPEAGKMSHRDDEDTLVIEDPDKHPRKKKSKKVVKESADVEMAVREEFTDQRPKGKRKREMAKLENEINDSGEQQEAPAGKKKKKLKMQDSSLEMPLVAKKLLQVAETRPESPPVKKKKARVMDDLLDVVCVKKKKKKASTETLLISPTVKKKKKLKLREEGSPDSTLKIEVSESPVNSPFAKKKKKKKNQQKVLPDCSLVKVNAEASESPIQSAFVKKKKKKKRRNEQKVLPDCSLVEVKVDSPVHLDLVKKKKRKEQEVPRESTLVKFKVNESPSQVASVKKEKEHQQEFSARSPSKARSVGNKVIQELESVPKSRIVPYKKDKEEEEVVVYEVMPTLNGVDPVRWDSDSSFNLNSEAPILPIPTELPRGTASWYFSTFTANSIPESDLKHVVESTFV